MSDVFISYSRKDKAFVERFEAALRERDREAWVDWEGIRPTEEFMRAIYSAIEGADTFIFVLTPDSIASPVCRQEVEHAQSHKKRMVPVVVRDVQAAEVPGALAPLNWIFCRESDDFQQGIKTLIVALDTDLDWVRAHTRLVTRAVEWEARGRRDSLVLRQDDLRAAELWLTEAVASQDRQPTSLQAEYILASRRAASRSQRLTLGAVSAGFIIAVVLAVFALSSRREAVKQKNNATVQRDNAVTQEKAARETLARADFGQGIDLIAQGQPARALAYLARAVEKTGHPAAGTRIVTLLTNRAWPRPLATQRVERAERAYLSRDGRLVLAVQAGGRVELRPGDAAAPIKLPVRGILSSAFFSPDGASLVTVSLEPAPPGDQRKYPRPLPLAQLWDAATGQALGEPAPHDGKIAQVLFGAASKTFATCDRGAARIFDLVRGQMLHEIPGGKDIAYDSSGQRLMIMGESPGELWDARLGKRSELPFEGEPGRPFFDAKGERVATCANVFDLGELQILDVAKRHPAIRLTELYDPPVLAEFSAGGEWLLTLGLLGAQVRDAGTGKLIDEELKHSSGKNLVTGSFSPDGRLVATVAVDGTVCIWDPVTTTQAIEMPELRNAGGAVFSEDGRQLLVTSQDGLERTVWDLTTGCAQPSETVGEVLADHGYLVLLYDEKTKEITARDRRTEKVLLRAKFPGAAPRPQSAFFANSGRRLLVIQDKQVYLWDLTEPVRPWPVLTHDEDVQAAELSPGGRTLLTVTRKATLWDLATGRRLWEIAPSGSIWSAHFSHDGRRVVTAAAGGTARIYDAADAHPLSPALLHEENLNGAIFAPGDAALITFCTAKDHGLGEGGGGWMEIYDATGSTVRSEVIECQFASPDSGTEPIVQPEFSPEGHLLVRAGRELSMRDLATGKPVGRTFSHRGEIGRAIFSPSGRVLATAGADLSLWNAATGELIVDPLAPPPEMIFSDLAFSSDSRRIVAHSHGGHHEGTWNLSTVYDVASGAALTDARPKVDQGGGAARFAEGDDRLHDRYLTWDLAPPGAAPAWLAELATVAGGCVLNESGAIEPVRDRPAAWRHLAQTVAALPASDPWAAVGRWFLAPPDQRTISPDSQVYTSQYLERVSAGHNEALLESALKLQPGLASAHARLGAMLSELGASPENHAHAGRESLAACLLAPKDPAVWRSRARVLTALQRPTESAAATKQADALTKP